MYNLTCTIMLLQENNQLFLNHKAILNRDTIAPAKPRSIHLNKQQPAVSCNKPRDLTATINCHSCYPGCYA